MYYEGYEKQLVCDDCGKPMGKILIGGTRDTILHNRLGMIVKRAVAYCSDCMDNH